MSVFERESLAIPERTYHGIIPEDDYRKVIIKEPGIRDALLQSMDGSQDFNWGYGGGGPRRLANALATDAFDDDVYGEAFGWSLEEGLVKNLNMKRPFVVSRDRIVVEGLVAFNEIIARSSAGEGQYFVAEIQRLIAQQDETRKRMMKLLSKNAMKNIVESGFGLR